MQRGWRLLSDEFGLVRPGSVDLLPLPRLMPLKNESITVMQSFAPQCELGPMIRGTPKGDIRHLRPPAESIRRSDEPAPIRWIVFPRWSRDAVFALQTAHAPGGIQGNRLNTLNYELLGHAGFTTVRELVNASQCMRLNYSNLEEAVAALTVHADNHAR